MARKRESCGEEENMRKIFVHIGTHGKPNVGNGGKVVLTNIANELGKMGYETYAFASEATFTWDSFKWLSHDKFHFKLATTKDFLSLDPNDYRIISCFIRDLDIPNDIKKNIRYWDMSEVFRNNCQKSKRYVIENYEKIAICNPHLESWYRKIGFKGTIIPLTNWINNLFYWNDEPKIENSVGWQKDMSNPKVNVGKYLAHADLGRNVVVIPCHGNHKEVATKMRKADFFVFWGHHCSVITIFKGEIFGLPMYEAMASGCVVVARRHEGNKFMKDVLPLVNKPSEIARVLKRLMENPEEKENIRAKSLKCIEERFRFDEERRNNLRLFLE